MSKTKQPRQTRDAYFMAITKLVSTRSVCLRRKVGAILVVNKRIIATGYNGPPKGLEHCDVKGCIRDIQNIAHGEHQEICRGLHAEQNALIQSALSGSTCKGATIYITHQPCNVCAKMLINAEIVRIVYSGDYPDTHALEILAEAKIQLEKWEASA